MQTALEISIDIIENLFVSEANGIIQPNNEDNFEYIRSFEELITSIALHFHGSVEYIFHSENHFAFAILYLRGFYIVLELEEKNNGSWDAFFHAFYFILYAEDYLFSRTLPEYVPEPIGPK